MATIEDIQKVLDSIQTKQSLDDKIKVTVVDDNKIPYKFVILIALDILKILSSNKLTHSYVDENGNKRKVEYDLDDVKLIHYVYDNYEDKVVRMHKLIEDEDTASKLIFAPYLLDDDEVNTIITRYQKSLGIPKKYFANVNL